MRLRTAYEPACNFRNDNTIKTSEMTIRSKLQTLQYNQNFRRYNTIKICDSKTFSFYRTVTYIWKWFHTKRKLWWQRKKILRYSAGCQARDFPSTSQIACTTEPLHPQQISGSDLIITAELVGGLSLSNHWSLASLPGSLLVPMKNKTVGRAWYMYQFAWYFGTMMSQQ